MIIDESSAVLPLWMLIAAAFGFMVGELCGDYYRRWKCLTQANEDLRAELEKTSTAEEPIHEELKYQRGVLHDVHKQITVVSKALEKHPS
ncbi:MAG TPA: hypothetical protein VHD85_10315 [Terracidiphilus sp.]|nr:hypothetical protein [Terracidiphilus sp.]